LLVLFDREEAIIALLRQKGHIVLTTLKGTVAKKAMKTDSKNFYQEIIAQLQEYATRYTVESIISASPAFWNDYLLKEMPAELKKKTIPVPCSSVDEQSIAEVIKRPELRKVLEKDKSSRETMMLHELMEHIAHDMAGYGERSVKEFVTTGNAKEIIVSEHLLKKMKQQGTYRQIEGLLIQAERMHAQVHIISTEESCKKLDSLGGVACLLRWKTSSA
jgi:stalled ribosome rescue protein Dom34